MVFANMGASSLRDAKPVNNIVELALIFEGFCILMMDGSARTAMITTSAGNRARFGIVLLV